MSRKCWVDNVSLRYNFGAGENLFIQDYRYFESESDVWETVNEDIK